MTNHLPKTPDDIPIHYPVVNDHGIFARHDVACPVCQQRHAVLYMNTGIFHPCWRCQNVGFSLVLFPKWIPQWVRRFFKRYIADNALEQKTESVFGGKTDD